jgi:hypothetical protein
MNHKVSLNIKKMLSPSEVCKESNSEYLRRFSKYIKRMTSLSPQDLESKSTLEVFQIILNKTHLFEVNKGDEILTRGLVKVNQENKLIFKDESTQAEYLMLYHDNEITVQDLQLPMSAEINGRQNTNLKELFLHELEYYLERIVINSVFSRYTVYTKYSFLKRLTEIKWALADDLRWAIKKVESEMGIVEKEFLLTSGKTMIGLAPQKKMIHNSCGAAKISLQSWETYFPEEKNLLIQGGEEGLVFSKDGNYLTAFVEVFPKVLKDKHGTFSSFIRGEGKSFEAAEKEAFDLLFKAKTCPNHDWEPRGRTDGCGYCKNCNVFNSSAFPELKKP